MTFWQKNKWKIIAPVLIVLVLAAAFVFGDRNIPEQKDPTEQATVSAPAQPTQDDEMPEEPDDTATPEDTETATEDVPAPSNEQTADEAEKVDIDRSEFMTPEEMGAGATGVYEEVNGMMIDTGTGKDEYLTDPVPEGKPQPVEPQDVTVSDTEYTCTISISCASILKHMDLCDKEKVELVPEDGWLLKPVEVTFKQGQSVFDVLQQVCKDNKLHMEFSMTPIYNSAYIEGIGNLYEFDCGEVSGWIYKVNDWFPNYGCSRYQLQDGDVVEWEYTCELGKDIGGGYATGGDA